MPEVAWWWRERDRERWGGREKEGEREKRKVEEKPLKADKVLEGSFNITFKAFYYGKTTLHSKVGRVWS